VRLARGLINLDELGFFPMLIFNIQRLLLFSVYCQNQPILAIEYRILIACYIKNRYAEKIFKLSIPSAERGL
jgi:hypothetical protein